MFTTERTLRVAPQFELAEFHVQGIIQQQAVQQRRAGTERQFEYLGGLDQSDNPRQYPQNPAFSATGNQPRWRRFGIEATVARSAQMWREYGRLAFESENRAVHIWLFQQHTSVIGQVASGEIIRAIHDDVVGSKYVKSILAGELRMVKDHFN